ncbi:hypothetical protein V1477_018501 [Vespula maculifrons]|uniref:Uncharacterized protein n=1 Tax=Vespula maculifrons TaxID=7453 RepID=A0ABD2AY65_VESMC
MTSCRSINQSSISHSITVIKVNYSVSFFEYILFSYKIEDREKIKILIRLVIKLFADNYRYKKKLFRSLLS